jgi:hypothetical protein
MPETTSSYGRVPVYGEEWGESFMEAMRTYVDILEVALEHDTEAEVETLSGMPFCGCSDCYEREVYLMATKLVLEGQEDGKVWLE